MILGVFDILVCNSEVDVIGVVFGWIIMEYLKCILLVVGGKMFVDLD